MKTLHWHADPGHAWLAVSFEDLLASGIGHTISKYSYIGGRTAYLEEDCDAGKFLTTLAAQGVDVEFTEHHTNGESVIRNMSGFNPLCVC